MAKNLLVTLADKNYLTQAKHFFVRAYFYSGWQGDYMLLAHEVPEEDLRWFRQKGILIYHCKSLTKELSKRWPPVVLSKFYLFQSEFKKWDKIIYGDADLVINSSLDGLLKNESFTPINLNYFRPVPLLAYFDFRSKNFQRERFLEINQRFDLVQAGFSGTVFCLPTKLIKDSSFDYLKSLIPVLKFCRFGEELALNLLFFKQWQAAPIVYALDPQKISKKCLVDPKELKAIAWHFGDADKPWLLKSDFYPNWQQTMDLIKEVDLTKRVSPKNVWSELDIQEYQQFLFNRYYNNWSSYFDLIKRLFRQINRRFKVWFLKNF